MKLLLIKSGLFAILAIFCMSSADRYFLDHENGNVAAFEDFYAMKRETVDVMFLGNSHLLRGIDPALFEAKTGLRSGLLFGNSLTIAKVYYNLLETLSYQKPQLVVIESWTLLSSNKANNSPISKNGKLETNKFGSESYKKLGFIKLEEIYQTKIDDKLFNSFALFRNHERWINQKKWRKSLNILKEGNSRDVFKDLQKNLHALDSSTIIKFNATDFKSKGIRITPDEQFFLDKINELSKKHDFKILLFTAPVYAEYYKKTKQGFNRAEKQLDSFAKRTANVNFFDVNRKYGGFDETHVVKEKVFLANQHLSYKGIVKTTNELASFINANYNIIKKNEIDKETVEFAIVHKKNHEVKGFEGGIDDINNQTFKSISEDKTFIVKKGTDSVTIRGWMRKGGIDSLNQKKQLVLLRDLDFFLVSGNKIKARAVPNLVKHKGKAYRDAGFSYEIPKTAFDQGIYKVLYVIQSENRKYFVHDSKIKIQIE